MKKPIRKLDGRSKEARALRAKTRASTMRKLTTAELASRTKSRIAAPPKATKKPMAKRGAVVEPSFDTATTLRILALQMASNNVGRDTAPRDLVPLARQIEEFLNSVPPQVGVTGSGALAGYPDMSADELAEGIAAQSLHSAEHAFD